MFDAMIPLHEIIVKKFPVLLQMSKEKLGVKVPAFPKTYKGIYIS